MIDKPQYFTGEEPYCPIEWTPPLSPDAPSLGPKARGLACRLFKQQNGKPLELDDFQVKLIDSILELYPDDYHVEHLRGKLRYRQAIVSIPRRNGKSTIASVLITYALCVSEAANIGVLASTKEQAKEVYDNVKFNFENNDLLKSRFKTTNGKGIESKRADRPAHFKVHAGKGDSLQGITFVGYVPVVMDELHITKTEAYDAALKGASTIPSAVVVGITTAGDDNSDLLMRLYASGRNAIAKGEDHDPRFGFWHWTVDAESDLWDRDALLRANPAAHSNPPRIDIDQEILEGKANPAGGYAEFRRYRRNEFVSADNAWLSLDVWKQGAGDGIPRDCKRPLTISIDKSRGWEWATVTAAVKIDDVVYTERFGVIKDPDLEQLEQACKQIHARFSVDCFVVNSLALKDLAINLKEQHGLPTVFLSETQMVSATTTTSSLLVTGRLKHNGNDNLIKDQLIRTVVDSSSEGVKVSVSKSKGRIDSVRSLIMAVYYAEKTETVDYTPVVF